MSPKFLKISLKKVLLLPKLFVKKTNINSNEERKKKQEKGYYSEVINLLNSNGFDVETVLMLKLWKSSKYLLLKFPSKDTSFFLSSGKIKYFVEHVHVIVCKSLDNQRFDNIEKFKEITKLELKYSNCEGERWIISHIIEYFSYQYAGMDVKETNSFGTYMREKVKNIKLLIIIVKSIM
ncbi:15538_t:CDS:2, partial [Dentiscutata heterogama]